MQQSSGQMSASSSRIETVTNMFGRGASQTVPEGLLGEVSFNIMKKMFVYGAQNLDLFKIIYPPIKELLRDVKDFEHSFEVKLAIYQLLLICKDNDPKQDEVLKLTQTVLK
jgi:hypothetical protein